MILAWLTLSGILLKDSNDHMALKTLIERIEMRALIAAVRYRDADAKSCILLQAVSAEAR